VLRHERGAVRGAVDGPRFGRELFGKAGGFPNFAEMKPLAQDVTVSFPFRTICVLSIKIAP
jgi:hypothetical protein